jgi:putative ABC transport system substrate-binding protein
MPSIQRVAVLGNAAIPGTRRALHETEEAAAVFGIQVQYLDLRESRDIDKLFLQATKAHVGAVLVLSNPVATSHRVTMIEAAARNHLPVMYPQSDHIDAGGLLYYGVSITDLYRRAAKYVDKILRGAKPADLPVEQPTKFELDINLKTAKQIGLTIPPNVLARADRVIR